MNFIKTAIDGVIIIEPKVWGDSRGYFMETFRQDDFEKHVLKISFIQDNEAKSSYGVLRGLHFQKGEYAQAKLVRVVKGAVLDVAVDLRKESPTYGKHVAVELNDQTKQQLFIPRGFAHGYLVLQDDTIFCYKVDSIYMPTHEGGILYNDPDLKIDWRISESDLKLSEKDRVLPRFSELNI